MCCGLLVMDRWTNQLNKFKFNNEVLPRFIHLASITTQKNKVSLHDLFIFAD